MNRTSYTYLKEWKNHKNRKPLIIRGARQVGKTYLVRQLGKSFPDFVEINFEFSSEIKKIFERDLDPLRIVNQLSLLLNVRINPGTTLLFFDEIQEAPKAIASLRYFSEMVPELHLIAAGSLIEFALEEIGLPVGRVEYLYLYPLTFIEFLRASGNETLAFEILKHDPKEELSEVIHDKIFKLLGEYFAIGGMPEAIKKWIEYRDLKICSAIHRRLIESFRHDFSKYAKKYQLKYVSLLFDTIPAMTGQKFMFSRVPGEFRKRELEPALQLLQNANIVGRITHSAGQGIPLGAQITPELFKTIFLDIALAQTILGTDTSIWLLEPAKSVSNMGAIVEAFIGQELLAYSLPDMKAELFYWHRENRGSSAEVDYLICKDHLIVPVEVKSGTTGRLTSIRMFLESHKTTPYAIRFWVGNFSIFENIHSMPLYAVGKVASTVNGR
jgi:predicted AAA+ superfamily ATPase